MMLFVIGLCLFFVPHSFTLCREARARVIARLGVLPYRGLYSLISLAGLVLVILGYGDLPEIQLWAPPAWTRHLTMVVMMPVFVLLVAANMPGKIKAKLGNPMLLGVKIWAVAHLLTNGELAAVALFGSFLLWAVIDLVAVKRGGRSAIVAAPKPVFDLLALSIGLGLYAAFLFGLHALLFGVPLIAR